MKNINHLYGNNLVKVNKSFKEFLHKIVHDFVTDTVNTYIDLSALSDNQMDYVITKFKINTDGIDTKFNRFLGVNNEFKYTLYGVKNDATELIDFGTNYLNFINQTYIKNLPNYVNADSTCRFNYSEIFETNDNYLISNFLHYLNELVSCDVDLNKFNVLVINKNRKGVISYDFEHIPNPNKYMSVFRFINHHCNDDSVNYFNEKSVIKITDKNIDELVDKCDKETIKISTKFVASTTDNSTIDSITIKSIFINEILHDLDESTTDTLLCLNGADNETLTIVKTVLKMKINNDFDVTKLPEITEDSFIYKSRPYKLSELPKTIFINHFKVININVSLAELFKLNNI